MNIRRDKFTEAIDNINKKIVNNLNGIKSNDKMTKDDWKKVSKPILMMLGGFYLLGYIFGGVFELGAPLVSPSDIHFYNFITCILVGVWYFFFLAIIICVLFFFISSILK